MNSGRKAGNEGAGERGGAEASAANRVFDESFLETCHAEIRTVYSIWKGLADGDRLPSKQAIDPAAFKEFLPFIMLVDVVRPGPRFRYRLVGTGEVEYRGNNPTGRYLEEAFSGPDGDYCDGNYRYVSDHAKPLYDTTPEVTTKGNTVDSQVIFLPLGSDGKTVDTIMVFSVVDLPPGERLSTKLELANWAENL